MEISLAQLCASTPGEFAVLQENIQRCGNRGHSYEFLNCKLSDHCQPQQATLGFWQRAGSYWIYLRPAVDYRGESPTLAYFFRQGALRFPDFSSLAEYLCVLGRELPPPRPLLLEALAQALRNEVLGQPEAVEAVAWKLYGHVGKSAPQRPLSLIFHGPTGVGKSKLGRSVAPVLNKLCGEERYHFVSVELNTFTQPYTVSRLIGAPPGYAGYGDAPLFQVVEDHPHTVFLLDELDKAHPEVLKVFLSILDEGLLSSHLPDHPAWDFRRCILLFTTNSNLTQQGGRPLGFSPPIQTAGSGIYEQTEEGRKALARGGIPPETAGRFGGVIAFSPLDRDARGAITAQQITALGQEYGLTVTPSPTLAQALTPEESFSVRSNAAYLEGILTPVFLGQSPGEYLLAGTPQAISLLPKAPPKKGPESVKAGSMPGSRLSWGPDGKDAGHPR